MSFRERLVEARTKAGISQAELAKRLDVSTGTVAAWEGDGEHSHGIRMSRLQDLAAALGVPVSELIA